MVRRFSIFGLVFISVGLLQVAMPSVFAEDFEGAALLVQKLNEASSNAVTPSAQQDDPGQLAKDTALFSKQSEDLSPQDAARKWLALFDRGVALQNNPSQMDSPGGLVRGLFDVLPGPESWPELEKEVGARPLDAKTDPRSQLLLQLILHTLKNEEDHQWADLDAMVALQLSPQQPNQGFDVAYGLPMLGGKLSAVAGNPDAVYKFWDQLLAKIEQPSTGFNSFSPGEVSLDLPDFVTLLGATKAEPLLLRALLLPGGKISSISGLETQRLARKLVIDNIDKVQQPPWVLTQSLEGATLYEALKKKFPADANSSAGAIYYVLALVTQGKSDRAVKAMSGIDAGNLEAAVNEAADKGWADQVYDFLHTLLVAHPESAFWSSYLDMAAQTGHAQEALQFVQATMARKDLTDLARVQVLPVLYKALLGVDRVDEGIEQLRTLIKTAKGNTPNGTSLTSSQKAAVNVINQVWTAFSGNYSDNGQGMYAEIMSWGIQLARIGHLLKRDDLEKEGLDDVRQVMKDEVNQPAGPMPSSDDELISYLMETGRNAEAEKLLIDRIVKTAQDKRAAAATPSNNSYYDSSSDYNPARDDMVKLALVYYNAGRWSDILTLVKQVPGWAARDLADVAGESSYLENRPVPNLGLMVARALVETGHEDEARPILDYALQLEPGNDAAYALLLKIGQGDLVAKLDALYQQDQFQNRPLIWKATVLLQQGKVAEAEKACKTAITVDPSDGETGKGDRMRVYSVMADVCDAKHDAKQAAFFRNVVKAIRLSEDADDYYEAGLLTHAVNMYAQALDLFSDAYCIQSRIARQLAELGRTEEAAVHYRKAFELMPVSFGRMESHCFGCERAFKGKTAVDIAEKTFTDMLAKDPTKPQISYLLGYLYMEEERYPEALVHFQRAAELDPDYINAWKQIIEIGENYQLSPELRDSAVFNVMRLDPAGRHISLNTADVRQLAKLWNAEEAAQKAIVPAPKSLLSLPASAAELAASEEATKKQDSNNTDPAMKAMLEAQVRIRVEGMSNNGSSPRSAILNNGVISACLELFH